MKHLTKFETEQLYTAAQSNLDTPNVSLIEANMGLHYAPYVAPAQGGGTSGPDTTSPDEGE